MWIKDTAPPPPPPANIGPPPAPPRTRETMDGKGHYLALDELVALDQTKPRKPLEIETYNPVPEPKRDTELWLGAVILIVGLALLVYEFAWFL